MHRNHMLLMFLCCLVPLAILGGLFIFGFPVNIILIIAALLFCAIIHGVVMFALMNRHGQKQADHPRTRMPSSKESQL